MLILTINERIFLLLKERKYTQKYFSKQTNISEQTISAWKSRKTDPPAYQLSTIADFLNVSIDYLVTGNEKFAQTHFIDAKEIIKDTLTPDERMIVKRYREADEDGKDLILEKIEELWAERIQPKGKSSPSKEDKMIG